MGARIRAHDWAATPLGPIEIWPQSLRTAVEIMLAARQPAYVAWGPELTSLHNDGYISILGTKHPGALGKPYAELWAEVLDEYRPMVEATLTGEAHHFVDRPVALAGRPGRPVGWFTFSWTPLRDGAGAVAGFFCTTTETTEKVRAEAVAHEDGAAALREGEARFRALVQASSDVLYRMGPDWAEMRQLSGSGFIADAPDPTRDWLEDYIHPDDWPRVQVAVGEAIRAKRVFELEHRVLRPDGGVGWVFSRAVPILDARGEIEEWFGAARDVTARREAEVARRASEERLSLIVENVRDYAIFVTGPDDRIETWPPGAAAVYGWTAEEAVGRQSAILFTPEDREAGVPGKEVEAARRDGAAPNVRWHLRKDGSRVFIEGSVRVLHGPGGDVRGFLKVGQDATARRASEERQALLMREVDHRAKNALALVMSVLRLTPKDDAQAFARAVEGRVAALARAQTLLAGERWRGTDLCALLEGELAPFLGRQRAELGGPPVALPAAMVQSVGMAVHELATNALKYGALSAPDGKVSVSWCVGGGAPPGTLQLRWAEAGGPPVAGPPARQGFGSRVLDGTVRRQLGGRVSLAWDAGGLICDLEVPLGRRDVAATAEPPRGEEPYLVAAVPRRQEDGLAAAERHVREAEACVTHQSFIVEAIDGGRHPRLAALARRTLATLQRTLDVAREGARRERKKHGLAPTPEGSAEREMATSVGGRTATRDPETGQ